MDVFFSFCIKFFTKKITFFSANRFYLLASLLLGILIPIAEFFPAIFPSNELAQFAAPVISGIDQIQIIANEPSNYTLSWSLVLTILYLIGFSYFMLKFLIGLNKIYQLKYNNPCSYKGAYYLVETKEAHLPFSFFDHVFISNQYPFREKDIDMILSHEKCHINQKHSWDIVFIELTKALFWCSPLIYFYKKEIKQTHEFIADAFCTNNITKQDYSQLLLQTSHSDLQLSLSNNFFNSFLQKRIHTMLNSKSKKITKFRYLLFIPLLLGLSILFMSQTNNSIIDHESEVHKESNDILGLVSAFIGDTIPQPPPAPPAPPSPPTPPTPPAIPNSIPPPPPPRQATPNEKAFEQALSSQSSEKEADDVFKVVEEMPRFPGCEDEEPSSEELRNCSQQKMLEYIYTNITYPKEARDKGLQGVVVVQFVIKKNGTIENAKIVRNIGGGCGEQALKVVKSFNDMPEKWRPGYQRGNPVKVMYTLPVKFKLEGDKKPDLKGMGDNHLIILDGVEISKEKMESLNQDEIATINIYKGDEAKKYRTTGDQDVIVINSKPPSVPAKKASTKKMNVKTIGDSDLKPLIILDGKEISNEEMEAINPDDIESVDVTKGEKAAKYGEKGKNGVVIITLKKHKTPKKD